MSYDRMLLILTFVVAIIGLILGSVAVSREDSHEFIDLTNSSSSILSSTSMFKNVTHPASQPVKSIRFFKVPDGDTDKLDVCLNDKTSQEVQKKEGSCFDKYLRREKGITSGGGLRAVIARQRMYLSKCVGPPCWCGGTCE